MINKSEMGWWKFLFKQGNTLPLLMLLFGFTGCSNSKSKSEVTTDGFQIKTANPNLRNSFRQAKLISDSLARIVIAPEKLGNFYCRYHFEYYDEQRYENDSINKMPLNYDFTYYLLTEGDTIGRATVSLDNTLCLNYIDVDDFIGLRYILDGKFSVDKRKALSIGKQFGVDLNSTRARATAEFVTSSVRRYDDEHMVLNDIPALIRLAEKDDLTFYWVVENHCNGCMTLKINAETKVVYDNHRYMFVY
ncbi:hypothetical protein [Hymenobacter glacialis]|nr:hypothetical protein [Hymenobacter glacialis]